MVARVLILGEVFDRAKHMEKLLVQASFDVAIATSLKDSLAIARAGQADVLLLDGTVTGSDAISTGRAFKSDPASARVGVVVLTDADKPGQRLAALDAGLDETLLSPCTGPSPMMRMRSVAQLAALLDESRRMSALRQRPGLALREHPSSSHVLIVDPDERSRKRLESLLKGHEVHPTALISQALVEVARKPFDLALVSLEGPGGEGARIGQRIRRASCDKDVRLLAITDPWDVPAATLVENGIDDVLMRPIDRSEALFRIGIALKKQALRASIVAQAAPLGRSLPASVLPEYRIPPPDRFAA